MTIGSKFILVFSIFFVAVITGAYFVFNTIRAQQVDKTVVNLAGRQRMLTQKYTKEYINELIPLQVRHSTLKAAEIATIQIVEDRKQYTKNIIGKLKKDGVVEVHPNRDYAEIDGGIPLPATFVQEVSSVINEKGVYSYDLLSKWNINKEKGLSTDFEREAFDHLYSNKGKVFSRFMVHNSIYTLRYATSDIASAEGCVNCHNNHEGSPKKDFKLGDVMGVLIVNIPIGTVSAQTEAFFAVSEDKKLGEDSFLKTRKIFDTTLGALINGGEAPVDLEMTKFTTLPPTADPKIRSKLTEVKQLWNATQVNLKKITEVEPNSAEYIVAYGDSYNSINLTMKTMNEAVNMYQANSDRKSAMLLWIQGGSVGMVCMVIGLGWLLFAQPLIRFLKELVSGLSESSDQVSSATVQISASSQSLAQGTSEQASSLEEASSSMEEMASMTKQNSANAEEAAKLVDMCSVSAEGGNKAVVEMNSSMEEINASNKKIAEITKVIDGIAFQTNLLALNAAVEAARAGEHGKGFAVVAEEVRNLAQRSATAAKDTANLIEDSVAKADNGAKLADKCRESLEDIVKNVGKVTDLTKEIANASGEQSEGIEQVSNAVQQMDVITQQNAANAEETASASEEMSAQAQNMKDQVGILAAQVGGASIEESHAAEATTPATFLHRGGTLRKQEAGAHSALADQKSTHALTKRQVAGKRQRSVRKAEPVTDKGSVPREPRLSPPRGNGDGLEDSLSRKDVEAAIPMGSASEHDERLKDF
ncbi:MAG: methyl-accepting chemotaxis protein [Candidatus Scalindua sp.]